MAKTYDPTKYTDPLDAFFEAANDLGISPTGARGHLSQITNYLNANGFPGWESADANAGDYVAYKNTATGWNWGWDVLPAGDKSWIRLDDTSGIGAGASRPGATAANGNTTGSSSTTGAAGPDAPPPPDIPPGLPPPPNTGGDSGPVYIPPTAPGGNAGPAGGIPGVSSSADQYAAAYQAMARRRSRASGGGRQATILGGFGSGAPATKPATLLGY